MRAVLRILLWSAATAFLLVALLMLIASMGDPVTTAGAACSKTVRGSV